MTIPESQFETWAHQGTTEGASALYYRIDAALHADPVLSSRNFEVFLQGSYRNSTNIRGDSDVDVVVKLNDTYMPEYGRLDPYTKAMVELAENPATYGYFNFRQDVSNAIHRAFPHHAITEGAKSIKIPRTPNNIPADVVPCLTYRLYVPTRGLPGQASSVEGIWLQDTKRNVARVSFPKQYYDNGVAKHRDTGGWYKPAVRIFKNARGWMEDNGLIKAGVAPSHAIECVLYNVPGQIFGTSHANTFVNAVTWLSDADLDAFYSQNGIQKLFDTGQWSVSDARTYINALARMWDHWGRQHARLLI